MWLRRGAMEVSLCCAPLRHNLKTPSLRSGGARMRHIGKRALIACCESDCLGRLERKLAVSRLWRSSARSVGQMESQIDVKRVERRSHIGKRPLIACRESDLRSGA